MIAITTEDLKSYSTYWVQSLIPPLWSGAGGVVSVVTWRIKQNACLRRHGMALAGVNLVAVSNTHENCPQTPRGRPAGSHKLYGALCLVSRAGSRRIESRPI